MRFATVLETVRYLGACYIHALRIGKAIRTTKDPKHVVIIQGAKLGDMVTTTPMFRAVKKKYPQCRVTVVGNAYNQAVLLGNTDVDEYIPWRDDIAHMAHIFREKNFDFGCFTSPSFRVLAALYLASVPAIAATVVTGGFAPSQTMSYRLLLPLVIRIPNRMHHYVPRERLRLLEPIDIHTDDTKKYIYSTEAGKRRAETLLRPYQGSAFRIGILSGAGNKIKQWPPERLAAVADYLIEQHHATVILIGTDTNREEADAVLAAAKHRAEIVDCTSKINIDETIALISKLDLLVGVDSAPMHFADAEDTATVVIAGNIDEHEHTPNDGKLHLVVVPKNRGAPQILTLNSRVYDHAKAVRQMESVSVEEVLAVVDQALRNRKKSPHS